MLMPFVLTIGAVITAFFLLLLAGLAKSAGRPMPASPWADAEPTIFAEQDVRRPRETAPGQWRHPVLVTSEPVQLPLFQLDAAA